jgi:purine-binding chemotaxis protein CheW
MQRHRHDPSKNLVGFVVGDVEYAVAIARVKEIANPLPLVALPHAPRAVVGVADYRGEVVSVIDLRTRFGLPAAQTTRKTKWIVVDVSAPQPERSDPSAPQGAAARAPEAVASPGERLVALVVDAVTEVFGTGGSELRPAPSLGSGDDVRGLAGVTNHANGLVFVLDTGRLRDLAEALAKSSGRPSLAPGHSQAPDDSSKPARSRSLPLRTPT